MFTVINDKTIVNTVMSPMREKEVAESRKLKKNHFPRIIPFDNPVVFIFDKTVTAHQTFGFWDKSDKIISVILLRFNHNATIFRAAHANFRKTSSLMVFGRWCTACSSV